MPAALWSCPSCGRTFANRNQSHFCGSTRSVDEHFVNREAARPLFDAFVALVRECGPVEILPEKTRIAFHVRMSFAQITPRRDALAGHLVLARRVEDPRFHKVETISARNHVHHFRVANVAEVEALREFVSEAYAVGEQKHLPKLRAR